MSKTREEEQAVKIVNTFWNFNGSRSALTDEILKALQQARKDGARDEVTLGFRHFSDFEFVRDYFKVRLAELDAAERRER